jgi:hypothetical protein
MIINLLQPQTDVTDNTSSEISRNPSRCYEGHLPIRWSFLHAGRNSKLAPDDGDGS